MRFERFSRFLRSKRALAIPVTYLILFASLIAIVTLTYSFAIAKISAKGALVRAAIARQGMQDLDSAIHSIAWTFGASEVLYMEDCGGIFKTSTSAKRLVLNLTDEQAINTIVFNSLVGEAFYELEPSEFNDYSAYIRGDDRAIINNTAFSITQLYVTTGTKTQNIILCYRPLAVQAEIGISNGKPLNLIRVSILNLNSSGNLAIGDKFHLRVTSSDVATVSYQYQFNSSISSLALKATFDGTTSVVWLPVSSTPQGAVVSLEIVTCKIRLQRAEV